MKRIVSGITATGKLTLGNYIGAIRNLINAQEDSSNELFMFVADLHAITLPIDPQTLRENIRQQLAIYLACGIDVNKVRLFKQSEIKGHTELFYYLTCNSYLGQLNRMTQFKDKSQKNSNGTETITASLLMYPVLMAADILLYNADSVIVGADQKQHVELTRDLAERMNTKFNIDFTLPEPTIQKVGARIMALRDPSSKMSKSDDNDNNTIYLLDDAETIKSKIMSSLTDSENIVRYSVEEKPGVSNLLTIFSVLKGIEITEAEAHFHSKDYKQFKEEVAQSIIDVLIPIQERYNSLTDEDIENALSVNREYIQNVAKENILKVEKGMGIK